MAWFGLLYMGKLAVFYQRAGLEHVQMAGARFQLRAGGPCTATFWEFDLTAHQLAVLCASMTALSTQLVKGYSVPARQLDRIGFLCVVMPNIRADCEQKPPNDGFAPTRQLPYHQPGAGLAVWAKIPGLLPLRSKVCCFCVHCPLLAASRQGLLSHYLPAFWL